jgi:HPt (histidine-containing phosphotransfer) domain-containing protein
MESSAAAIPCQTGADRAVFDKEVLLEWLGGDDSPIPEFVEMFVDNVSVYLEKLVAAIAVGDIEQTRIQAHTIKGAAANISAPKIHAIASGIELMAKSGLIDGAAEPLHDLERAFAEFRMIAGNA